ncbi:MAG TPA: hypothetical protein VGN00_21960 [Puia sp.]
MKFRFPIKTIADRMGIDRGNLSAYLSGKKPISERFIQRFYYTFAEDLKITPAKDSMPAVSSAEEDMVAYGTNKLESQDQEEIEQLKKINNNLTRNLTDLIESNRMLADSNQKLVEAHVLLINKKVNKA